MRNQLEFRHFFRIESQRVVYALSKNRTGLFGYVLELLGNQPIAMSIANSNQKRACINRLEIKRSDTLTKRASVLVGNSIYSDMTFFLEKDNEEIPAHKILVALASNELENIVFGDESISPSNRVIVKNISVAAFRQVLSYIYTDKVSITQDNALQILHYSNAYKLQHLETMCTTFLVNSFSVSNICPIFESVYLMHNVMVTHCIQFVSKHADQLLENRSLLKLNKSALIEILKMNHVNLKEYTLFKSLLQYGTEICQVNNQQCNSQNKRQAIEEYIKYVRFPALTPAEFAECLKLDPAFFTDTEIASLLLSICSGSKHKDYSNQKRTALLYYNTMRNY